MPDTTQPADPVAAYLAEVRERSEQPLAHAGSLPISHDGVRGLMESAGDVPRLLAAVEAVLAVHRPDGVHGERRPDGQWDEHARCWESTCPDEWPCPTHEAISAALLGSETAPAGSEGE